MTWILPLLATCSNEIGFADNVTTNSYFPFSKDLFSSLFLTFSDKMGFFTVIVTSNTFSDESFCHKKLKLLVMNKLVTVDEFSFMPTILFGAFNLAKYFPFSDDLFSSLFLTFSDKMGFITDSVTSNTFNNESFCCKKT